MNIKDLSQREIKEIPIDKIKVNPQVRTEFNKGFLRRILILLKRIFLKTKPLMILSML